MKSLASNPRINSVVARARREILGERAFVVGANGNGRPPGIPKPCFPGTGVPPRPDCFRRGCRLCDLTKCANSVLSLAAATAFELPVEPVNTMYFEPIAAEIVVTLATDENTNRRVRITAVSIGGSPQEGFDNRNPAAATTQFVYSDVLLPSGFGPVPVPWGIFTRANNSKPLLISLFNANADAINVQVTVYGNAYDSLPMDYSAGSPPPCGTPWGGGGWGGKGPSTCDCSNGNGGGGGGGGPSPQ